MQRNEWDLPQPPGVRPVKGPRVWLWVGSTIAAVVLIAVALYVPVPLFYEFVPGPVSDVQELVEVENIETYSSEGKLFLTTVNVDTKVTVAKMIAALFDDSEQVVFKEQVTGGSTLEELEEQQRLEMRTSKQQAKVLALGALGVAAPPRGSGARVAQTVPSYPAHDVLEEGDVILEMSGRPVSSTCDAMEGIRRIEPGQELTMTIERGSERESITVETVENPNEPGTAFLGVAMEDVEPELDSDIEVRFKTGEIAGPSAGLMFSLALYDQLTPEDLTGGRKIAGTGTIGCKGVVGPIGGIEQKIAAAEDAGAELFLSPDGNFEAARSVADEIKVVAISDFDEALSYLEGNG
ncbi:MAG: PDZ domain-containing protein [Actinobacteria bacterium]|nr:PDZ domain-containing protein [Actinomycetota bacterium]